MLIMEDIAFWYFIVAEKFTKNLPFNITQYAGQTNAKKIAYLQELDGMHKLLSVFQYYCLQSKG